MTAECRFPDFQAREEFLFDKHPYWFQGHMGKAKLTMERKLKDVDVLLEVRDARAPMTSAHFEITREFKDRVQRLVVLNKSDLVTPNVGLAMRDYVESNGLPCLLTNALEKKNLIKIKEFALDHCRAKHPRTLGLMLMVVGLPNVGKSTVINGMKNIAFAASRQQGKGSKLMQGVKWTLAKTGQAPGTTQQVGFFQLSNMPRLYCYDTPGISLMKKRNDPQRNTKLALLGAMPDHFAGEMYLADYLLFLLNRERMFQYVDELKLPGPTNDIRYLSSHVVSLISHRGQYWGLPNAGAQWLITKFRQGRFGKLCIDHIPRADEVRRLRLLQAQTEPPGPWGPPCYPDIPEGMELSRRPLPSEPR